MSTNAEPIELEPQFCDECGLLVWLTWPELIPCDDEDCSTEHECNP